MKCINCKEKMIKVIYAGFPMYLCSDEACSTVDGFWSWVLDVIPFNGVFFAYKGYYWGALWKWLTYSE